VHWHRIGEIALIALGVFLGGIPAGIWLAGWLAGLSDDSACKTVALALDPFAINLTA
jgi:hypothetical protein